MRTSAFLVTLAITATAFAQQRTELSDLVVEATRRNPEILAAQKKYEAAGQRPTQQRSLPDPMLSAGWNSTGNPLPGAGLGRDPVANIGFSASQQIPYPGKLRLKGEIASKEAEADAQEFRAASLNVISRLKQAFFRLHHTYVMAEVIERNRELLRSFLHATEARYAAGSTAQADVFRAQIQLTLVETRLIQLDQDRRASQAEINAILNRPTDTEIAQPADPHGVELTFTQQELMAKARDAPVLARDQKRIEGAGTAIQLARKDSRPDLTLNAGFFTMGTMGEMYSVRADLNIPLRGSRLRAEVAEKSHELAGAKASYEASARSLEFQIREGYLAAQTAQRLADLYLNTALPQARLTEESALTAYQSGASDFASVLGNYIAAIDYEMSYHEQVQQFHLALVRLEEITGVELIR
ncbi:MAG TPA: TolC family protein [Bryobacteraceae bacterium]|jgi:outer membrane protein TolC